MRKHSGTEKKIDLTSGEYRLLHLFMEHPDQVLSPEQILGQLWDHPDCCFDTNTASVYIRRLRLKIEDDPSRPAILQTVRGLGYCWKDKKMSKEKSVCLKGIVLVIGGYILVCTAVFLFRFHHGWIWILMSGIASLGMVAFLFIAKKEKTCGYARRKAP